jgi:hypothetical protein
LALPLAPWLMVIHGALLVAVQLQPAAAWTLKVREPPAAGTVVDSGDRVIVHDCPWVTVNVRPAIVRVPLRAAPEFEATLNRTVPLPLPLLPCVIVSQGALLVADQAHPAEALTATSPVPPAMSNACDSGEIENEHPGDWFTVTVWFATVSVPARAGPLVAWTENVTVPSPLPDDPAVTVIHDAPLAAVHAHPGAAVTVMVPVPPAEFMVCVTGATWKEQPGDCSTVNGLPATTRNPVRAGPAVGSTEKFTTPGPDPVAPCVMDIQGTLLALTHGHAAALATLVDPFPPAAPKACDCGLME